MIWIALALFVALLAVALGGCALLAWREPVRRGEVLDFTGARRKPHPLIGTTRPPESVFEDFRELHKNDLEGKR